MCETARQLWREYSLLSRTVISSSAASATETLSASNVPPS